MIWFSGDPHLWHKKIMLYSRRLEYLSPEELKVWERPGFEPCEETVGRMNRHVVSQYNHYVGENDYFFLMGDLIFGPSDKYEQRVREFRDSLKCKNIFVIRGNHDQPVIEKYFRVYDTMRIFVRDDEILFEEPKKSWKYQKIVLFHYPILSWQGMSSSTWHIHAHCHAAINDVVNQIPMLKGKPIIDSGIDSIHQIFGERRPVSVADLKGYFDKRKADHFASNFKTA